MRNRFDEQLSQLNKEIISMGSMIEQSIETAVDAPIIAAMNIGISDRIRTMSKGTKEKVQLILVMSRRAELYLLDEPIAGVDPAARDYILTTIINNYNEEGTVIISTHLISDIERILDEVIFIRNGKIVRHEAVDDIKEKEGKSIDEVFKDSFKMVPFMGVNGNDR